MKVVHYYARYLTHSSGVTAAIDGWARQNQRFGHDTEIWCARVRRPRRPDVTAPPLRVTKHILPGRVLRVPVKFPRPVDIDVIYLHEGWVLSNVLVAMWAMFFRIPYVLMPHGVYEFPIVANARDILKLRSFVESIVVRNASAVHIYYPGEAALVQRFAGQRRVDYLVVPNGAPVWSVEDRWVGGGDYILWMGRFDVCHKGLDLLLQRWAEDLSLPRLVLVGPDYDGGREKTRRIIDELGLSGRVEIHDSVSGQQKVELMRACSGYVHPSRWEACSITMLEMLSMGVPAAVSASIHAAAHLGPLGAVLPVDFEDPSHNVRLRGLKDNAALGARGFEVIGDVGTWDRVGEAANKWIIENIAPRNPSVPLR